MSENPFQQGVVPVSIETGPSPGARGVTDALHLRALDLQSQGPAPTIASLQTGIERPKQISPYDIVSDRRTPPTGTVVSDLADLTPSGSSKQFFEKLSVFFKGEPAPTNLRSLVDLPTFPTSPSEAETKAQSPLVRQAIADFEQSQKFATGMALLSSFVQTVMASAKRLTQGQ